MEHRNTVEIDVDDIAYVALHRFDGGMWEFHATDMTPGDPAPTHILVAIENLKEGEL